MPSSHHHLPITSNYPTLNTPDQPQHQSSSDERRCIRILENDDNEFSQEDHELPLIRKPNNKHHDVGKAFTLSTSRLQKIVQIIIFSWALAAILGVFHLELLSEHLSPHHPSNKNPKLFPINPSPTKQIPLPLPTNQMSVVLMNHSRPRMVRESSLMRTLLAHPNIGEILLLHSNPNTSFEFVHPKVVNVDASRENDEIGLSLRFHFCQSAKYDWVIHVDDDMEFSLETLSEMLIEFHRNPKRIVGRFGRTLADNNYFNGYSSKDTHLSSDVILTKFMMMERHLCHDFFTYANEIWEDLVLEEGEGPLWNGEDIFMSLVANLKYGHANNYAMDWLKVKNAPDYLKDYDNGKLDISGGMKGFYFWDWHWWQSVLRRNRHYSYRGMLWKTAKTRLEKLSRG